jgi:nucleoside phosphorylase
MINLVVALNSEAGPLVRHYRMSRHRETSGYRVYARDDMRLVVTGVGKMNAAGGVAYLGGRDPGLNRAWLNVGLAGHECLAVGTGIVAHKITDRMHARSWYPRQADDFPGIGGHVVTYDHAITDYPPSAVCEMEAAAFYFIAKRFSGGELIQCYKVVSDNAANGIAAVSPALARELIGDNLNNIDGIVSRISDLARQD